MGKCSAEGCRAQISIYSDTGVGDGTAMHSGGQCRFLFTEETSF